MAHSKKVLVELKGKALQLVENEKLKYQEDDTMVSKNTIINKLLSKLHDMLQNQQSLNS